MIDFRYHIVSLIAVFLALTLGIVIGTTQLNGAVLDNLRDQVNGLTNDKRGLQQDVHELRGQVKNDDTVTAAVAPRVVTGMLKDSRVVLVATAQADGAVKDGLQKLVEQAGAKVTGRVQLTDDFTDPRRAADVKSFVTGIGQPAGFQLPATEDAGVLAGALLAHVLLRGSDGLGANSAAGNQVLSGFASLQMLRLESAQVVPADYAVVVSSGPVRSQNAADRIRTLTALVAALDRAGKGAVVAGTAAGTGPDGLVGAIRADSGLASAVSTVDDSNTAGGRLAVIFALTQQSAGRSGQYGLADNAQAQFPPTQS